MWIVICFDRSRDTQTNEAVVQTEEALMNYINTTLTIHKDASVVMIPKASHRINRKMLPLVTSKQYDFYVQWFD